MPGGSPVRYTPDLEVWLTYNRQRDHLVRPVETSAPSATIRVRHRDGAETTWDYFPEGERKGLLKQVATPNGLTLGYRYDNAERLSRIAVEPGSSGGDCIGYEYDAQDRLTGISFTREGQHDCAD